MAIGSANSVLNTGPARQPLGFLPPNEQMPVLAARIATVPRYKATDVNSVFVNMKDAFARPRQVWKDELTAISAKIERLNPNERCSLVNLLARSPDASKQTSLLSRWLTRATAQNGLGPFDGLGQTELTRLWTQLVPGQDKANLVRIFGAIGSIKHPAISGAEANRMRFAGAVAATGNAQQKLDFVAGLKPFALAGAKDASTSTSGRAIATVIAETADPKLLSAYVQTLGRKGLDVAVEASAPIREYAAAGSQSEAVALEPIDTRLFRKLASTFSQSTNALEKAAFVAATGNVLDNVNVNVVGPNLRRKELGELSEAISTVISTDTNGIIENVLLQTSVYGGSNGPGALRSYVQALLDSGQGVSDAGVITQQLQRGNNLREEPTQYLAKRESRSGQEPTFVRAAVLGGWLGLVGAAVNTRSGKRDTNAALSSLIFSGTADAMKEVLGARFAGLKGALGIATPALKTSINTGLLNWRNEATKADRSFAQGLVHGAIPRYKSGVEVTAQWTQTLKVEHMRRLNGS
jgi:hypothetical protein